MARLVALTDRRPDDTDWKGAFIWRLILALAESQHEVLVLTSENPESLPFTHPRLTVARPIEKWSADHLPKLAQAMVQFRPEILHTFALRPNRLWSPLTVWPYMNAVAGAFPQVRRYSTLLDEEDFDPQDSANKWHRGAHAITVFTAAHAKKAKEIFPTTTIERAPLELDLPDVIPAPEDVSDYILVPTPVSQWAVPESDLLELARELARNPERQVKILGGWGDCLTSERRQGWEILSAVAGQVQMLESPHLPAFVQLASAARTVWLRGLKPDSWRTLLARHIAETLGKEVAGPRVENLRGSTANFISRLYTLNC